MVSSLLARQHVSSRSRLFAVRTRPAPATAHLRSLPLIAVAAVVLLAFTAPVAERAREGRQLHGIRVPEPIDSHAALSEYLLTEPIRNRRAGPEAETPATVRLQTYRVRPGDSLSAIAQRFGLRVDTVISFNDIRRARNLMAGMELRIPNADGLAHVVRRGDSLGAVATRYGISLNSLLDWNNLESAVIRPGETLFIPGSALSATERDTVLGRLFIYPTRGSISSRFGDRVSPFTGLREHHNGLDIAGREGTAVSSAMAGRVAMVGVNPVYGRYVIVQHADGFQTLYAHLQRIDASKAARVAQGQQIGTMGNTGYSTGPHLHFTIFKNHVPVDPLRYLH